MLWLLLGVMTAAAMALLLAPLMRARGADADRAAHDLAVYREQLRELDKDLEHGTLNADEAVTARLEVKRRVLAAADDGAPAPRSSPRWRKSSAIALSLLVPLAAFAIYSGLGSPGTPSRPFAERPPAEVVERAGKMDEAIASLAARLEAEPDNVGGWVLLGRSYGTVKRYAEAAESFRRAAELEQEDPELFVALGESLTLAAEGTVTPEAEAAFRRGLALAPKHPGARYYVGLAELQRGRARAALDMWLALAGDSPADAPWLPALNASLERVAADLGVDLAKVMPPPLAPASSAPAASAGDRPPGPGREDIEAAAAMSADERATMIRTMVGRLAARMAENPDDLEGWKRLGRARRVLGDRAGAREAYARAAALAPDDAAILLAHGRAIVEAGAAKDAAAAGAAGAKVPNEALGVFTRVLDLDPGNGEALWFTGLGEAQAGRREAAAAAWGKLLATLDPASAEHVALTRRLEALRAGQ